MNCPELDLLQQLVDDELADELRDQLVEHLSLCADCQKRIDSSAETKLWGDALSDLNTCPNESSLLEKVLANVKSSLDPWQKEHPTQSMYSGISAEALAWTGDGFELIAVLGQGGMGIVFKARETSLDRVVAVKVLSPKFAVDPSARERFLREARAAAAVNHPNVVTIHAVSDSGPLPYLVMEYVAGETLQERLDESGMLPTSEVAHIGGQVAAGLSAAHNSGVLHRDVKPANIFLDENTRQVKLGDFGLAMVCGQSQLTKTGMLAGTPTYVAPETLDPAAKPDHRADLFSLGSVLYAMCCGRAAFEGHSVVATLHQIANGQPTPVAEQNPNVPAWLGDIIGKLHEKDADLRYQSAEAVQSALETHALGSIDVVPPPARQVRSQPQRERNGSRLAIFVAVCVVAAVLAVLSTVWTRVPEDFSVFNDEGALVGSFADLSEAVEMAPDGSRIEIQGDGPYFVEPMTLTQRSLTLIAAENCEPVLRFEFEDNHEEDETCLIAEGDLSLEGLSLVCEVGDEVGFPCLVHASEGAFHADTCRFIIGPQGSCLVCNTEHPIVLMDCELHAVGGDCVELLTEGEDRVELEDCLLTGGVAIRIPEPQSCEIVLANCTLVAHEVFELFDEEAEVTGEQTIHFLTEDCAFKAFESVVAMNTPDLSREAFMQLIEWTGTRNVFSGPLLAVLEDESRQIVSWCQSIEDWFSVTAETDSTYSDEPFPVADEELWELLEVPEELDTEIFDREITAGEVD